VRNVKDREK
jgi:hypothetical protein